MNILIVKLSAIGDVIHTLPSLAALRRLYPDAHITWVVEEAASGLVLQHPLLDRTIVFRRKTWIEEFKRGNILSVLKDSRLFLEELKSRHYDLVIDFHGLLKSAMVVLASGGKRKLGYDSWQELSGLFLNEKIPEDMNKHAVDRYLDFPRHLGAETGPFEFILPVNSEAESRSRALMDSYSLERKKFIAVNPVAYWETKLWDNEKFAVLADLIKDNMKLDVVFTGSRKDDAADIVSRMRRKGINLGGETTLTELACIYKDALVVISTDSGPMHLAAAAGTPVIALFGPTDPSRTGPYGAGHVIIRTDLSCSPCLLKKCPTKKCMTDILPEQVLAAVKEIVDGV